MNAKHALHHLRFGFDAAQVLAAAWQQLAQQSRGTSS